MPSEPLSREQLQRNVTGGFVKLTGNPQIADPELTEENVQIAAVANAIFTTVKNAQDETYQSAMPIQGLETELYGSSITDFLDRYFSQTILNGHPLYDRLKSGDLHPLNNDPARHADFIHKYLQNAIDYGEPMHDTPEQTFSLDEFVRYQKALPQTPEETASLHQEANRRYTENDQAHDDRVQAFADQKRLDLTDREVLDFRIQDKQAHKAELDKKALYQQVIRERVEQQPPATPEEVLAILATDPSWSIDGQPVPDEIHNKRETIPLSTSQVHIRETVGAGNYLTDTPGQPIDPVQDDAYVVAEPPALHDSRMAGQVLLNSVNDLHKQVQKDKALSKHLDANPSIGSTATIAMVQDNMITVANIGDSRAMLVLRDRETGEVIIKDLTKDQEVGGFVERQYITQHGSGIERGKKIEALDGKASSIGCARSFGHVSELYPGLSVQPDITQVDISGLQRKYEVALVVACDGICEQNPQMKADLGGNIAPAPSNSRFYAPLIQTALAAKGNGATLNDINIAQVFVNGANLAQSTDNITVASSILTGQGTQLIAVMDGHGKPKGHDVAQKVAQNMEKTVTREIEQQNRIVEKQAAKERRSSKRESRSGTLSGFASTLRDAGASIATTTHSDKFSGSMEDTEKKQKKRWTSRFKSKKSKKGTVSEPQIEDAPLARDDLPLNKDPISSQADPADALQTFNAKWGMSLDMAKPEHTKEYLQARHQSIRGEVKPLFMKDLQDLRANQALRKESLGTTRAIGYAMDEIQTQTRGQGKPMS